MAIEVESAPASGSWQCLTAMSGYTGSCYYRWTGQDLFNSPGSGVLTYKININNPGAYNLRIRNRHDQPDSTEYNDVFTRMDGGNWTKTFSSQRGQWTWNTHHELSGSNKPEARYSNLSAGLHTFEIAARSAGFSIDRIHLYKDSASNPLDETRSESPQGGAMGGGGNAVVTGALRKWHPVTVTFDGPQADESNSSTFLNYRLDVTFTHQGTGASHTVPGYFAADGNAAETSATSGNKWRVRFSPAQTGMWSYQASFVSGNNVAVQSSAGTPTGFDGAQGSFNVVDTNKSPPDNRARGMLRYVGQRYLQFDNGEYFIKGGADAPETWLAYGGFDDTANDHQYQPHVSDWNSGDPTWKGGEGKGIIGALNYLSSKGMNAQSFLTMNVNGDGDNVWPWTGKSARRTYDISKLAQWNVVFTHADHRGMFLHFKTQENENDQLLDGGDLGVERKLYYRELIARFGHHQALNWNLGEEYDVYDEKGDGDQHRLKNYATYIHQLDPYDHPVVVHTYPGSKNAVYNDLLGFGDFDGPSLQLGEMNGGYKTVRKWVLDSANAGRPWVVSIDEPGNASVGVSTDDRDGNYNHDEARQVLWGDLMAGGTGVEWYFGYNEPENDLDCEDFTVRSDVWDFTRYARTFFTNYLPFENMDVMSGANANNYVFGQPGVAYAAYLPDGGTVDVDLGGSTDAFDVRWYDPRNGGNLQTGNVATLSGGGTQSVGQPPSDAGKDWAVLVKLQGAIDTHTLTVNAGSGDGDYPQGATVTINADAPAAGKQFDRWTGDTQALADPSSPTTTVSMPANDLSVTATYKDGEPAGDRLVSMTLIDADADQPIDAFDPLPEGAVLNLATLPSRNLNIRADTAPAEVGSVQFDLDGEANFQTENVPPYALSGNSDADYDAWTPSVGDHVLTATPYEKSDAGGQAGAPLELNFEVVDDASLNTAPTVIVQAPSQGEEFHAPATIDVRARVIDPDGSVAQVVAQINGRSKPMQSSGPKYNVQFDDIGPGPTTVRVTGADDAGKTTERAVDIIVNGSDVADTGGLGGPDADAGPGVDARTDDNPATPSDGCGCTAGGPPRGVSGGWLLLIGILGGTLIRRRRSNLK